MGLFKMAEMKIKYIKVHKYIDGKIGRATQGYLSGCRMQTAITRTDGVYLYPSDQQAEI
jgi:hypothetical protein